MRRSAFETMPLYKGMNIVRAALKNREREDAIAKVDWDAFGRAWVAHQKAGEASERQMIALLTRTCRDAEAAP